MKETIYSDTTRRYYEPSKVIRLLNMKQMAYYMNHGIEILDFYPSKDFKTDEDIMVYVVSRDESNPVYEKWLKHKENLNNEKQI